MDQPSNRIATAASWLVGVIFVMTALSKLFMVERVVQMADAFKMPHWTLIAVGLVELSSGVLLVTKRGRASGAMGICATMLGAILSHVLTAIEQEMILVDVVFFAVCTWLVMRDLPAFLRPDWEHDPHGHPDTGKNLRIIR